MSIFSGLTISCMSLTVVVITYFWLHDDPKHPSRRRARSAVLTISGVVAIWGGYLAYRNGEIQALMQHTILSQGQSIDTLKKRLTLAEDERSKQYAGLHGDVQASNDRIRELRSEAASVESQVDDAEKKSEDANARAVRIADDIRKSNAQTDAKLTEVGDLAKQAAAKAGVYHLPEKTRNALLDVLGSTKSGTIRVACYTGMESACKAFAAVFAGAGWKVTPDWAQRFYTGAGLDAPIDPNPDTGLIVWYTAGNERLGDQIAGALSESGFAVDSRLDASPGETDITLGIRFLRQ